MHTCTVNLPPSFLLLSSYYQPLHSLTFWISFPQYGTISDGVQPNGLQKGQGQEGSTLLCQVQPFPVQLGPDRVLLNQACLEAVQLLSKHSYKEPTDIISQFRKQIELLSLRRSLGLALGMSIIVVYMHIFFTIMYVYRRLHGQ